MHDELRLHFLPPPSTNSITNHPSIYLKAIFTICFNHYTISNLFNLFPWNLNIHNTFVKSNQPKRFRYYAQRRHRPASLNVMWQIKWIPTDINHQWVTYNFRSDSSTMWCVYYSINSEDKSNADLKHTWIAFYYSKVYKILQNLDAFKHWFLVLEAVLNFQNNIKYLLWSSITYLIHIFAQHF